MQTHFMPRTGAHLIESMNAALNRGEYVAALFGHRMKRIPQGYRIEWIAPALWELRTPQGALVRYAPKGPQRV